MPFTIVGAHADTIEYLISFMDGRTQHDPVRALYEASFHGCVNTLKSLMQTDPLILSRISLTSFSETPLHIAALLGHLEFTQVLLERKPDLANETDSEARCPLHLASAGGHTEVVRELLRVNADTCLAFDQDDMLPLHLAVIRGRVQVIKELIRARPEAIFVKLGGNTFLHMCVRYNRLEAMKLMMELVHGEHDLIVSKDKDGNTVLHLAVMLRQIKTIKYLLSIPEVREESKALNNMGLRAADLSEHHSTDLKWFTIQQMLIELENYENVPLDINDSSQIQSPTLRRSNTKVTETDEVESSHESRTKKWWRLLYKELAKLIRYKGQGDWIEETRGTVMIVATVIATMTFQSTLSPPGGVWQENTKDGGYNCKDYTLCEAGTAVLAYAYPQDYLNFVKFNTTSFFSSIFVVLLLTSGFPLKNRIVMTVLTIAMCITITFMGLTFMWAQGLVIPDHLLEDIHTMGYPLAGVAIPLLLMVGLLHMFRFFFWVKKKNKRKLRRSTTMSSRVSPALL